jgi:hypothetical protein
MQHSITTKRKIIVHLKIETQCSRIELMNIKAVVFWDLLTTVTSDCTASNCRMIR